MIVSLLDWTIRLLLIGFSMLGLWSCFGFAKDAYYTKYKKYPPLQVDCQDGTCIILARTPWAKLVWLPNWVYGIAFYLLTIVTAIWFNNYTFILSVLGTVLSSIFSLILIYALTIKLKAFCRLCYIAHAANFGILSIWIVVFILSRV